MKSKVVIFIFFVFVVLHHDVWNWDNKALWFGFLPAGLGYHAAFSVIVGIFWYLVSRFAWPHATEAWAEKGPGE